MIGRTHAEKPLLPQQTVSILILVEKSLDQCKVQLALIECAQQHLRIVHRERQCGRRVLAHKLADERCDDVLTDALGRTDAQAHGRRLVHRLVHLAAVVGQRSRHAPETLALLGQAQRLALIDKQAAAVMLLQKVDVLGDGRLGDAQPLSRASVVHGLA